MYVASILDSLSDFTSAFFAVGAFACLFLLLWGLEHV
jgi:hypothetical protein